MDVRADRMIELDARRVERRWVGITCTKPRLAGSGCGAVRKRVGVEERTNTGRGLLSRGQIGNHRNPSRRLPQMQPFVRPKKECVVSSDRSADNPAKVVLPF